MIATGTIVTAIGIEIAIDEIETVIEIVIETAIDGIAWITMIETVTIGEKRKMTMEEGGRA